MVPYGVAKTFKNTMFVEGGGQGWLKEGHKTPRNTRKGRENETGEKRRSKMSPRVVIFSVQEVDGRPSPHG